MKNAKLNQAASAARTAGSQQRRVSLPEMVRNSTLEEAARAIAAMGYGEYFPEGTRRKYTPTKKCTERGDLLITAANKLLDLRSVGVGICKGKQANADLRQDADSAASNVK